VVCLSFYTLTLLSKDLPNVHECASPVAMVPRIGTCTKRCASDMITRRIPYNLICQRDGGRKSMVTGWLPGSHCHDTFFVVELACEIRLILTLVLGIVCLYIMIV